MVKVKICGITNLTDALLSVSYGADALGFIFYEKSPRFITVKVAEEIISVLPPFVQTVGVFVNETADDVNRIADTCKLDCVQLSGEESAEFCKKITRRVIKAFRIKDERSLLPMPTYKVGGYLLDAFVENLHGGTGETCDWTLVRRAEEYGPIILAGGLTPDNVAEAILQTEPYGVDVCSGVEESKGKKDPEKIKAFIRAARNIRGVLK